MRKENRFLSGFLECLFHHNKPRNLIVLAILVIACFNVNADNIKKVNSNDYQQRQNKNRLITGTVFDENAEPIPFAAVCFKGTTSGCVAADNGKFSIQVPNETKLVLEISSLGYITKVININNQTKIDVTLKKDIKQLDEIVATGYQKLSTERASGSFAKVDSKQLETRTTKNILDKLEGQSTGVLFNSDGSITIRGVNTLHANTKPLYVVDGFPISGDMSTINPNDVESVTVLKDAAAASIWGARASNGVIVVTTKQGNASSAPTISFNSSFSISKHTDLHHDLPWSTSSDWIDVESNLVNNNLILPPSDRNPKPMSEGLRTLFKMKDGSITQEQGNKILNSLRNTDTRDEFADLFMRNKTRQSYNISIKGGGDKSNYFGSVNYDEDKSQYKHSGDKRIISNFKLDTHPFKSLRLYGSVNTIMSNSKMNRLYLSSLYMKAPYQRVLDSDGNRLKMPHGTAQHIKDQWAKKGLPYDWDYNLLDEYDNKDNTSKSVDLRLNAGISLTLLKGLTLYSKFLYEWGDTKNEAFYNENTFKVRDMVNMSCSYDDQTGKITPYIHPGGELQRTFSDYNAFTFRNQLSYMNLFGEKHLLTVIAGTETRRTRSKSSSLNKYGFDRQTLQYQQINHAERYTSLVGGYSKQLNDESKFLYLEDRFISYYTNLSYTYNNKYTVTGSVRLDDSNLFGSDPKYRNVPLWSAGFNWQINKEDFMQYSWINRLNLRSSYGLGGNIDKSTSPFLIAKVGSDNNTSRPYASIEYPANPKLRWEKTSTTNIGLDYSLFNNRFYGALEYYNKHSDDLLGNVSLNPTYGFTNALMNTAEVVNQGIDFSFGVDIIRGDFNWTTQLNYSMNKNKVKKTELPNQTVGTYISGRHAIEGKPISHIYSYKWAGLSKTGDSQIYDENGKIVDYKSNMESIDGLEYSGTLVPKIYGSLQNNFSYKGFNLSVLMTYKTGHVFRAGGVNYSNLTSSANMQIHKEFSNRWKKPGDESITNVPRLPSLKSDISSRYDDYYLYSNHKVEDASSIRIRNISLSYNLPSSIVKSMHLQHLSVGTQLYNVGVITFNKSHVDPEYVTTIEGDNIKPRPELTFSIKGTF